MRQLSQLGCESQIFSGVDWFKCGGDVNSKTSTIHSTLEELIDEIETIYVQDMSHIGTKDRNLILKTIKDEKKLPFGKYHIQQA